MLDVVNTRLQQNFIRKNFVHLPYQTTNITIYPGATYIGLTKQQDVFLLDSQQSTFRIHDIIVHHHCSAHLSAQDLHSRGNFEFLDHLTSSFNSSIAIKIADELSALEMQYLFKIIDYIFSTTENVVTVNDVQNVINTYDEFKYYICNYKTKLNMINVQDININVIRCNTIEPDIILAVDKLDGIVVNDIHVDIQHQCQTYNMLMSLNSKFALLIQQPQHVVKFIDKKVYDRNNLTKFKWLLME